MDKSSTESLINIHGETFNQLVEWAKKPGKRDPIAVFLYGGPGVGKTTLAYRVCEAANLRAVECNASHVRNRAGVAEIIQPLLKSNNVADFFRPEGHRPLGVILDEIDGMSSGDRGGLTEIIKALKEYDGANAIFCISNEWADKKYRPLMRLCLSFHIEPPSVTEIKTLLIKKHPDTIAEEDQVAELSVTHQGDLRKILQVWNTIDKYKSGNRPRIESTNRISRLENLRQAVMQILNNEVDILREVALENNDMNLAGLHLHETLPHWLKVNCTNQKDAYVLYRKIMHDILQSDRIDYYTFFFQYWNLFPYSYTSKLQAVNTRLFYDALPKLKDDLKEVPMIYTSVLSRQSWLFNQFKYLGEVRDFLSQHKSSYRNGGFECAYRVLIDYNKKAGTLSNPDVWKEVSLTSEMPPTERLQKWLEVLLPPPIKKIGAPIIVTAPTAVVKKAVRKKKVT